MDANIRVFGGIAEFYDSYRPKAPPVLLDLLIQLAQTPFPSLVVDLGSGTGLSTAVWIGRAQSIIGIEPNEAMRCVAQKHTTSVSEKSTISYQHGLSTNTGLPNGCADIVTCAQSFHWMEPESTLAEGARILQPGGVFAAYDYYWPPTVHWKAELAYETFIERAWALKKERGHERDLKTLPKHEHLARMQESDHFCYVKELWVHTQESGNAERFIGLALTNGVAGFLQQGLLNEQEIGLPQFKQAVQETLGNELFPWYFSYCVRIGIKK